MDVIAAPAEIVVRIPGVGGSQNGDFRLGRRGRHDPREGKGLAGWCPYPQIVQSRPLRRDNGRWRREAALVPAHARLREIAVREGLTIRLRTVLVDPADHPDEFLLPTVSPESHLILHDGVDPVFRLLTRADPLRPH